MNIIFRDFVVFCAFSINVVTCWILSLVGGGWQSCFLSVTFEKLIISVLCSSNDRSRSSCEFIEVGVGNNRRISILLWYIWIIRKYPRHSPYAELCTSKNAAKGENENLNSEAQWERFVCIDNSNESSSKMELSLRFKKRKRSVSSQCNVKNVWQDFNIEITWWAREERQTHSERSLNMMNGAVSLYENVTRK